MKWWRRGWGFFLAGMLGTMATVVLTLLLLTQTDRGRERIMGVTLDALGGQVNGQLLVDSVQGGMFTGARMYRVRLIDPGGATMISADSANIAYRLGTFFGGDIVINRLTLYGAEILLERAPRDTAWNFQEVLRDTTPDPDGPGKAIILHQLRLVDGTVTVRMPWEPSKRATGLERTREIDAALSDSSRVRVETAPGGWVRTIVARTEDTLIRSLAVAPDERGGIYLQVLRSNTDVDLYRNQPLRVRELEAELNFSEGALRYTAPRVRLPQSKLGTAGVINTQGGEINFDVFIRGDDVALQDIQWILPTFPDRGKASFRMEIESRPDAVFLRTADLKLSTPGSRLSGDFTLLIGDQVHFSGVSLRADPLDVDELRGMLPGGIPVQGLEVGAVQISSPAS